MAAPVRQAPFLLDERNGRIFPFDPILAKHRAMKPHYKAPVVVRPAAEQAREDMVNYHERPVPPVEQRPVVHPSELETQQPEAKAEKKDGRSKAARDARKAQQQAPQLTAPAQSDIDDIIGDLGGDTE